MTQKIAIGAHRLFPVEVSLPWHRFYKQIAGIQLFFEEFSTTPKNKPKLGKAIATFFQIPFSLFQTFFSHTGTETMNSETTKNDPIEIQEVEQQAAPQEGQTKLPSLYFTAVIALLCCSIQIFTQ